MFKEIIFTLLVVGCAVAFPQFEREGRVVGGRDATIEEFPHNVALFWRMTFYCGGAILNVNTIVSAAHCTNGYPPSDFQIRAGSSRHTTGGQLVGVTGIIQHPSFDNNELNNDIVIIKLARNLVLSAAVRAIALPVAGMAVPAGSMATFTGWGGTNTAGTANPTVLQALNTAVISNAQCTTMNNWPTRADQLCAGGVVGRDTCYRDEGGPLIFQARLVGINSWGFGPNCAVGRPIVYTRVPSFIPFITRNL